MTYHIASVTACRAFKVVWANQRGQGLIELGIIIVLLVTLVMGIIEFGYAWLEVGMITHAARDGARAAAVVPSSSRTNGIITDSNAISNITTLVTTEISSVMDTSTLATPTLDQPTVNNVPMVRVTVTGTVPYIFNLPVVGNSFTVNRSVSFRDEGR